VLESSRAPGDIGRHAVASRLEKHACGVQRETGTPVKMCDASGAVCGCPLAFCVVAGSGAAHGEAVHHIIHETRPRPGICCFHARVVVPQWWVFIYNQTKFRACLRKVCECWHIVCFSGCAMQCGAPQNVCERFQTSFSWRLDTCDKNGNAMTNMVISALYFFCFLLHS